MISARTGAVVVFLSIAAAAGGARASEPEAVGGGWPAAPVVQGGGNSMFEFTTCNRTHREASVAIVARVAPGSKDYMVSGWWRVAPLSCRKIGSYPRGHFFAHAESGSTRWGKSAKRFCVEVPGPFKRFTEPKKLNCPNDLLRTFNHQNIALPTWEWVLYP